MIPCTNNGDEGGGVAAYPFPNERAQSAKECLLFIKQIFP